MDYNWGASPFTAWSRCTDCGHDQSDHSEVLYVCLIKPVCLSATIELVSIGYITSYTYLRDLHTKG